MKTRASPKQNTLEVTEGILENAKDPQAIPEGSSDPHTQTYRRFTKPGIIPPLPNCREHPVTPLLARRLRLVYLRYEMLHLSSNRLDAY